MLSILFLALEKRPSDVPNNDFYKFSSRYRNSSFSVTIGLVAFILFSAENLELVETNRQIESLVFFSHQELDGPKIQKYAITIELSRHAN